MPTLRNEIALTQGADQSTPIPPPSRTKGLNDRKVWHRLFVEFWGYGVVSLIALGVDTSILKALVDLGHIHYLPASVVGFVAGVVVAYVLSARFVFTRSNSKSGTTQFLVFTALGLVGLLVNSIVLSIAISGIGLGLLSAKGLAAGCTFITNFALRRTIVFAS